MRQPAAAVVSAWVRPASTLAMVVAFACSRSAPPVEAPAAGFLRATPIVEHGPPSIEPSDIATSGGMPAEQLVAAAEGEALPEASPAGEVTNVRRAAPVESTPTRGSSPAAIIAEANALARQAPEAEGFLNAVMNYNFVQGAIYEVFTAPNNHTDLVLEPGEELTGPPIAGDTLRWRLDVGKSAVDGVPQQHIFLKPTRAGLSTNLTLNTNRRTYFLRLQSVEEEYMVAVQWTYPQSAARASVALTAASAASAPPPSRRAPTEVSALNFDYAIEVVDGKPRWKPRIVYDDGQKTYIRFDPRILHGESPALYVIERGELQIVNYRVKENLYVVDRLFDVAELRLGQDEQDVVRLRNRRARK